MILVNEPLFQGNEKKYLIDCIDTAFVSSEGQYVKKFEKLFADYIGVKHAVSVCNGTVAIEMALNALGVGPGDEVIIPSFTIISCAMGIIRLGATPVLVDSEPSTWNMDVNKIEAKITPNTKIVMPVHMYGHPVDMEPVIKLSEKYGFSILEDAAEVHGAEYKGKKCGSMGKTSTFSFYANKIITTGEGGMVVTNEDDIAEKLISLRNLCFQPQQRFLHNELGYNFRMTNLQAALGVAQMEVIEKAVQRKIEQGYLYRELLSDVEEIELQEITPDVKHVFWVNGFVLKEKTRFDAKITAQKLLEKGIQTRPFFWPMHEQPVFKKMELFKNESYPVSERLARRGLYLPSGLALKNEDIYFICNIVKNILREA